MQGTSQPISSQPDQVGVFISYAREDRRFVGRLHDALVAHGYRPWVDWEGIPATAPWMAEVTAAIDATDVFCFVISPDSVTSEVCREEAAHASTSSKRIMPVLVRPISDEDAPGSVAAHNWIDFTAQERFDEAFETLVRAIATDPTWTRLHTRLFVRAREWDLAGRDRARLLRGSDLGEAEAWLGESEGKDPAPAPLHAAYVVASRRAAARRQRAGVGAIAAVLALSVGLSSVAVIGWRSAARNERRANEQRALAEQRAAESRSRELASTAFASIDTDPEAAITSALEALEAARTPEAEYALRRAVGGSWMRAQADEPSPAMALALAPEGDLLVTAGFRGKAGWVGGRDPDDLSRIWLLDDLDPIFDVSVSRDGTWILATASANARRQELLLVNANDTSVIEVPTPCRSFDHAGFQAGTATALVVCTGDEPSETRGLFIDAENAAIDPDIGVRELAMSGVGGNPLAGSMSPDGRWLAIQAQDRRGGLVPGSLVDLGSGATVRRLPIGFAESAFSEGSDLIVQDEGFDAIVVRDAGSGRVEHRLRPGIGYLDRLEISSERGAVVALTAEGVVQILSPRGAPVATLSPSTPVNDLAIREASATVFTTDANGRTRAWAMGSAGLAHPLEHGGEFGASSSGAVATLTPFRTATVYSAAYPEGRSMSMESLSPDAKGPLGDCDWSFGSGSFAVAGDGSLLAMLLGDCLVSWTPEDPSDVTFAALSDVKNRFGSREAVISPTGDRIAVRDFPTGDITLIADDGTTEHVAHDVEASGALAFDPSGRYLWVGGERITTIEVATGRVERGARAPWSDQGGTSSAVAFGPDGTWMVVASGSSLFVMDPTGSEVEATINTPDISAVGIEPDGRWFFALADGGLGFWDRSGHPIQSFPIHWPRSVATAGLADPDIGVIVGSRPLAAYPCDACAPLDDLIAIAKFRIGTSAGA